MSINLRSAAPAVLVAILSIWACDRSPTAPSGVATRIASTPTPSPGGLKVESFHMEGIVTTDDGTPVANAEVAMNSCDKVSGSQCLMPIKVTYATTDGSGHYAMDLMAARGVYRAKWIGALIGSAFAIIPGEDWYEDLEFVSAQSNQVTRNFQLSRVLKMNPGDTATAAFDASTGMCVFDDFQQTVCRYLKVNVPSDGTVTITATPSQNSSAAWIFIIDDPYPQGTGSVKYNVPAGISTVQIGIPAGVAERLEYQIRATFEPAGSTVAGKLSRR